MPLDETSIRQWADRHECRQKLPVLVRRLIRETTPNLISFRFPGNAAVDLHGPDGEVEVEAGNKWTPKGHSYWEMGCSQDPCTKAREDYKTRTDEIPEDRRRESSFVFVTPRRWNTKNKWVEEHKAEGAWAGIHAYDAIDIETWLEEAPATTRWLEELLDIAQPGILTPDKWWTSWSTAATTPISRRLVATRRHNEAETLLSKLRNEDRLISVLGDDRSEAVAFVIAALGEAAAIDVLDRTLVITRDDVAVPSAENSRLVIIADLPEGHEPDFGDRRKLTIVRAYPKGRSDISEPLQLSRVPSKVFRAELEDMGLQEDAAERLALETGHSIPVLRRRLSDDPEVKRPVWACDPASAKLLLPFALTGSWIEHNDYDDVSIYDDDSIVELLSEFENGKIKGIRDELLRLDDAPIARYGNTNVIVSQMDALFAVGPFIAEDDLKRFFQLAPELLGERDPALDLPQDQRWMADVLSKGRKYSREFLSGIGDALCILAVHGAEICGTRLQMDLAHCADRVVRSLMADASEERWLSICDHLQAFAEAAPTAFLDCLEKELQRPDPAIRAIMGPTEVSFGGECLRFDLLRALEVLAWHPEHFARVAEIVFNLQRFEINDNWSNSPDSTAKALFHAWLPATALTVAERLQVLRKLASQHRLLTLEICMSLLPQNGSMSASRTAQPKWRPLEQDLPGTTDRDVRRAAIEASKLLLDMAPFDVQELENLLEAATRLHPDDLSRLAEEIERWSANASDEEKAELWDYLRRRNVLHAFRKTTDDPDLSAALHRIEIVLRPETATARHRWLFQNSYGVWLALGKDKELPSLQECEERVRIMRTKAIAEIEAEQGAEEILPFALSIRHPEFVAQILVPRGASSETAADWAKIAMLEEPSQATNAFLEGVLSSAGCNDLNAAVQILVGRGVLDDPAMHHRLAEHLPGRAVGWNVAADLGPDADRAYWNSVSVQIWNDTPCQEVAYAVKKLLEANRPRSAFSAAENLPDRVSPELWESVLRGIARDKEPDGPMPEAYAVNRVFECLDDAPNMTDGRIAELELLLLRRYELQQDARTLTLYRELSRDPALFVRLLTWRYPRCD